MAEVDAHKFGKCWNAQNVYVFTFLRDRLAQIRIMAYHGITSNKIISDLNKDSKKNWPEFPPFGPQWTVAKVEAHHVNSNKYEVQDYHLNIRTLQNDCNENHQ